MPRLPGLSLSMGGIPISVSHKVKDLRLQCSCPLNFHEQSHHQTVVARTTATMILRAPGIQGCRLHTFKSRARSHLQFCPIILMHMREFGRIANGNVQRASTRNLLGPTSSLTYGAGCRLLGLDQVWLLRVELNLIFLFTLHHNNVLSAANVTHDAGGLAYLLRGRYYSLKVPLLGCQTRQNSLQLLTPKYSLVPCGHALVQSLVQSLADQFIKCLAQD